MDICALYSRHVQVCWWAYQVERWCFLGFAYAVKQAMKSFVQSTVLPIVYNIYCHKPINERLVVFAHSHGSDMPFSMRLLHQEFKKQGYEVKEHISDYSQMSMLNKLKAAIRFMKDYAIAHHVVICDYYLPAASCKKRKGTTLTQLWHSGGLMKKFAYDSTQDIDPSYTGNPFANYDNVTISAPCCREVLAHAMRMNENKFFATGLSRTDVYYDDVYNSTCEREFFERYPQAKGRTIILWAPTFRGTAASAELVGEDAVLSLSEKLGDDYFVVMKVHPHTDKHRHISTTNIPTERLLPVTDLLITDYSSVLFDYLLYERPFVLFAPDLWQYELERGLYVDYRSFPAKVVENGDELADAILDSIKEKDRNHQELSELRHYYMSACDGVATERVFKLITGTDDGKL